MIVFLLHYCVYVIQVQLGVLMENENTTEGMSAITAHQHIYVPGHDTEKPVRILSAGDQLTCERQSKALEDVRDSITPSKRHDGLIPVTGDFHLLANYYQVRMSLMMTM